MRERWQSQLRCKLFGFYFCLFFLGGRVQARSPFAGSGLRVAVAIAASPSLRVRHRVEQGLPQGGVLAPFGTLAAASPALPTRTPLSTVPRAEGRHLPWAHRVLLPPRPR